MTTPAQRAEELKGKANKHFSAREYQEAIDLYSQAIDEHETAVYYSNRSAARIELNQFELGLRDATKAVELDPKYTKAYMRQARCYKALGRLLEAKRAFQHVLRVAPATQTAITEIQVIDYVSQLIADSEAALSEDGDNEPHPTLALQKLQQAVDATGETIHIRLLQAKAMLLMKRYSRAQNIASDVLRENSTNAEALYLRGLTMYYLDKFALAVNHFKQVLQCDPDHRRARDAFKRAKRLEQLKQDGNEAFKSGDNDTAVKVYTEALTVDPKHDSFNSTLYCNRAAAHIKLGDDKAALSDCNEAIERDDQYLKAYARRAQVHKKLEMFEEQVRDLEKIKQLDPNYSDISSLLRQAKHDLKLSKRKDYYKILSIDKNADQHAIKKGYRKTALKWHPDKWATGTPEEQEMAEAQFKDVTEAFTVLSDERKKQRYDSGQDLEDMGGFGEDVDVNDIFQMFFNQGGGGGGRRGHPFGGHGGHGGFHGHHPFHM